jgi:hypothetical protein
LYLFYYLKLTKTDKFVKLGLGKLLGFCTNLISADHGVGLPRGGLTVGKDGGIESAEIENFDE